MFRIDGPVYAADYRLRRRVLRERVEVIATRVVDVIVGDRKTSLDDVQRLWTVVRRIDFVTRIRTGQRNGLAVAVRIDRRVEIPFSIDCVGTFVSVGEP